MGIMNSRWITPSSDYGKAAAVYRKRVELKNRVRQATLWISARGAYIAELNGRRVGNYFLAPGWTSYDNRIQYQQYDVTEFLYEKNLEILITVGAGWYASRMADWAYQLPSPAMIASLEIVYADGTTENIITDCRQDWEAAESPVRFNDIYDGETYDARFIPENWEKVKRCPSKKEVLIPQEGELLCEQQHFKPAEILHTPKGEIVLDFGQNLTGYIEFSSCGRSGSEYEFSCCEILDQDGNFFHKNYGNAKTIIRYISDGKPFTYHPDFTFSGFRYVRIEKWPEGEPYENCIEAVAVHSDMKRTGWFSCSDPMVNTLYQNAVWGQRDNFLDVPTDCPQRSERMGWTGDAQVFCRTASYNFDVERFFTKWLRDLRAEQRPNGVVPMTVPRMWEGATTACGGWGDATVICPWQIYMTYGDARILEEQYDSMCKWVDFERSQGSKEELWDSGTHFGDWLALDQDENTKHDHSDWVNVAGGPRTGKTNMYLLATAYFYYSTTILCKAGDVLGKDTSVYKDLAERIKKAFFETYLQPDGTLLTDTQTAYALTVGVGLAEGEQKQKFVDRLAEKIRENDNKLNTGFLGTPWLLPVLSDNGYKDLAVTLLLQKKCPSWLFPITMGATTIWERWNAVNPDGSLKTDAMCSFNHYAYGSVSEYLYGKFCGIEPIEPGFRRIRLAPSPDKRFDWAEASIQTRYGMVRSGWKKRENEWQYQFEIPAGCEAEICLGNNVTKCGPGVYEFYSHIED